MRGQFVKDVWGGGWWGWEGEGVGGGGGERGVGEGGEGAGNREEVRIGSCRFVGGALGWSRG